MSNLNKIIGNRLKKIRECLDLNISELSNVVEESPDVIEKIEKGEKSCSLELLKKYGECFNVNLNWLIRGVGRMFLDCQSMVAVGNNIVQVKGKNNLIF